MIKNIKNITNQNKHIKVQKNIDVHPSKEKYRLLLLNKRHYVNSRPYFFYYRFAISVDR